MYRTLLFTFALACTTFAQTGGTGDIDSSDTGEVVDSGDTDTDIDTDTDGVDTAVGVPGGRPGVLRWPHRHLRG